MDEGRRMSCRIQVYRWCIQNVSFLLFTDATAATHPKYDHRTTTSVSLTCEMPSGFFAPCSINR